MAVFDPKTDALRKEIYARMSHAQKMALAIQMREMSIAMVSDSIRRQRPQLPEDEVELLVHKRCDHLDDEYLERWIAALGKSDTPHPRLSDE